MRRRPCPVWYTIARLGAQWDSVNGNIGRVTGPKAEGSSIDGKCHCQGTDVRITPARSVGGMQTLTRAN